MTDTTATTDTMVLYLTPQTARHIVHHAETAYPYECVGFLSGYREQGIRTTAVAVRAHPVNNRSTHQHHFTLSPYDYLQADQEARAQQYAIIGCYHSHPDQPARPSRHDLHGAQAAGGGTHFVYLIQSVYQGIATELACWLLTGHGHHYEHKPVYCR